MNEPVIVLADGGTGGHVFPMIAVADALRAASRVRVVYVGTRNGLESKVVPARGDELELLEVAPIKGRGMLGAARGLAKAALTVPAAYGLVRRLAPRAVLSVGGYAAGPVAAVARAALVPLAILEPNGVLGLANRWLAPFARRAYVAFPEVERKFAGDVALRTGVPLRAGFARSRYEARADRCHVLVLGGSQGAAFINETLPRALARAGVGGAVHVVHQTGPGRDAEVRRQYEALGLPAHVVPFIDDMPAALADADLVIERAGASSLAELCAVGRASILLPYPFAADDHQRQNAMSLAADGAAVCVPQADASVERLTHEIAALVTSPELRTRMAARAAERGRPEAAREIALDLLRLAGIEAVAPAPAAEAADPSGINLAALPEVLRV